MPLDTDGFDSLMTDIAGMANRMDADGAGAPVAKRILEAAAVPIYEQMKANASSDPKIITGVLNRSIQTGKVRKRRYSGRSITIGVHRKEEGAYYAPPVEYGHGGPAPAHAHPFIRPAYDTRSDEAYEIIRDGLRDAIDQLYRRIIPMATPTASPQVSSTVGLKNVVIAPLTKDTETEHTYGALQLMAGAIEASITPENADPDVQHADDVEFDVLYPDPELTFKTKMADVPLAIQEMVFGNQIDDNGVLVRTASDRPPYFAVGFKSEKSDGTFRYVWLFKVRAKPVTENYATKEGTNVTRQTGEIEWTAIKRTHDNRYQAVADEGQNGFTAEKAATFLTEVYEPTFTAPGP